MKRIGFILIAIFIMMTVMLSGCHKNTSAQKDVDRLVKVSEDAAKSTVKKNEADNKYASLTSYQVSTLRDPFEIPVASKVLKAYPNAILRNYALDSLKLVGIVVHDNFRWAIFRANDGKLYKITVGKRIGVEGSLLSQIEPEEVKFTQDVNTAGGGQTQREIIMRIQEPN